MLHEDYLPEGTTAKGHYKLEVLRLQFVAAPSRVAFLL